MKCSGWACARRGRIVLSFIAARSGRGETCGERIDAETRRRALSRRVGNVRVGRRAAVRPSLRIAEDGGYRGENAIGGVS